MKPTANNFRQSRAVHFRTDKYLKVEFDAGMALMTLYWTRLFGYLRVSGHLADWDSVFMHMIVLSAETTSLDYFDITARSAHWVNYINKLKKCMDKSVDIEKATELYLLFSKAAATLGFSTRTIWENEPKPTNTRRTGSGRTL
jgi:hypothetical protein